MKLFRNSGPEDVPLTQWLADQEQVTRLEAARQLERDMWALYDAAWKLEKAGVNSADTTEACRIEWSKAYQHRTELEHQVIREMRGEGPE